MGFQLIELHFAKENVHKIRVYNRTWNPHEGRLAVVDHIIEPRQNYQALNQSLEGVDVVCHFISTILLQDASNFVFDFVSNVLDSIRLFHACMKNWVNKVISVSTWEAPFVVSHNDAYF